MYDIQNFYERTVALLASQFQETLPSGSKTNIQKLIAALTTPFYDINDTLLQLQNLRWLSTAQGIQLDELGVILGLARTPDQPDDDKVLPDGKIVTGYRTSLKFQIFINRSTGTPEEMIFALKFLTSANKVEYWEPHPAFYQMFSDGRLENFALPPEEIADAIYTISPAGVQYCPITCSFGVTPSFVFSGDPIVEPFYVAPNPSDFSEIHPLDVSPDGIAADPLDINRGQTLTNPNGGWFAETNYDVPGAGHLCEVLIPNGLNPKP